MSIVIDCQNRVVTGHAVKTIRRLGLVPAVVYGEKTESKSIQLNLNSFTKIVRDNGRYTEVDLNIDGTITKATIFQADLHPVTGVIRHVDFKVVK
jgi:large subunit ribosomal protein L25